LYTHLLGDNFKVSAFHSPKKFLNSLLDGSLTSVSLVLTDFKMPEMNGLDMIRKAQDLEHHFPFILLSGHLDRKAMIDAVDVGVFRLLEKPTEFEVLLSTIDQLLMEHEIYQVRNEIRVLTSQLRELYSMIRVVLLQHIPEELIERLVIEPKSGSHPESKMSFDTLMEKLESRLEALLASEKMILELKTNRFKP
jgi:FixJ family two-component response regulator